MNRDIDLQLYGIGKLLSEGGLRVPPNQREYRWGEDEVTQLLQDLTNAQRSAESYFLGMIVLVRGSNDRLEPADGQQRLATTTIILSEIRNRFARARDEKRASQIDSKYLFGYDLRSGAKFR